MADESQKSIAMAIIQKIRDLDHQVQIESAHEYMRAYVAGMKTDADKLAMAMEEEDTADRAQGSARFNAEAGRLQAENLKSEAEKAAARQKEAQQRADDAAKAAKSLKKE